MELERFRGEVKRNEPLSRYTSFRIGGPADLLVYPKDRDDLLSLLAELREKKLPYYILGGGTNILVRDGGFRGVVISLARMAAVTIGRTFRSLGGEFTVLSAEAGAPLSRLLALAVDEGLVGMEFASGIPGTVGGAVRMNAGTSVGEMGDVVDSVAIVTPDGRMFERGREEMGFGYRTTRIADGEVVVSARIILRRGDREQIKEQVKKIQQQRKERQPEGFPNAGSIFKNPLEESAGKLIDEAGLKGKTVGGAQVSERHANFIVNRGQATAHDVIALMDLVREKVLEVRNVRLEPEIKIIGEDG